MASAGTGRTQPGDPSKNRLAPTARAALSASSVTDFSPRDSTNTGVTKPVRPAQKRAPVYEGVTSMSQHLKLFFIGASLSLSLGCGAATRTAERPPCHGVQKAPVAAKTPKGKMQTAGYTTQASYGQTTADAAAPSSPATATASGCGGCPGMKTAKKTKASGEGAPQKVNAKGKKSGCKNPNLEQASRL